MTKVYYPKESLSLYQWDGRSLKCSKLFNLSSGLIEEDTSYSIVYILSNKTEVELNCSDQQYGRIIPSLILCVFKTTKMPKLIISVHKLYFKCENIRSKNHSIVRRSFFFICGSIE